MSNVNVIVVGAQWGDEGKGKIVDMLAGDADLVVRYQGGSNAGHTVFLGGECFVLHLIPSGILHPGKKCVIAAGVVVDPEVVLEEMESLRKRGYFQHDDDLKISDRAKVVLPFHKRIDALREESRGQEKIGTTGRGIGPAYEDKMARRGILFCEFVDAKAFRHRLQACLKEINPYLKEVLHGEPYDADELYETFSGYAHLLAKHNTDTSLLLHEEMKKGSRILFEGAQGSLLDVDHGSYPYVTASSTIAGGALAGAGVGPTTISAVIGVTKAYTTRVGGGPFPSQIEGELGEQLREKGKEYGATTGRPRRCGWFDAVVGRYAVRLNGLDLLAVTKLDVLTGLEVIKICRAYRYQGQTLTEFPAHPEVLAGCQPVYEEMPGWHQDISGARRLADLPGPARQYLERLAELLEVKIGLISVGSDREETVVVTNPFSPDPVGIQGEPFHRG